MISPISRLLTNVFSSWVGFAIRIVIAFLFVPYVTMVLGDARYGIWILVFQIVNYFFLFDIGLERALSRYLPRFLGLDDYDSLNRVLNTATAMYGTIAAVTIIAAALVAQYVFPIFSVSDPALLREGQIALFLVGLFVALRFLFFPFGGSLGAVHRFDIAKGLEIVEEIGRTIVYVILLSQGYGLIALAITMVAFSLARNLAGVAWLKRLVPEVRLSPAFINKTTVRMLFRYSRISFGVAVCWMILFNSDSILLGALVSSAAVGVYAPGAQVMLYIRHLINAIGGPLTPVIAHVDAKDSPEKVREVYLRLLTYVAYLGVFLCVGLIAYSERFVGLWLEPEFHDAYYVMFILGISGTVFLPQIIGNAVLFGIEKHGYLLWILLLEIAIKLGVAIPLLAGLGVDINGESLTERPDLAVIFMASAAALPQALLSITIYPILMGRALQLRIRTIWHTQIVAGALGAAITGPMAWAFGRVLPEQSWLHLIVNVVIVSLVAFAGFYILILEPTDRARLRRWLTFGRA
ncbi:oligosaccharide flippase family protein [candidate division GN15 bacterium]|nr:oligosaccharide flippase family protein [candidate division GN15 bacterium]